jgi:uncharacterized protein YPO0396
MRAEALGEHQLTVESCDNREQDMRAWLQARIDAEDAKLNAWARRSSRPWRRSRRPSSSRPPRFDASLEAAFEYREPARRS